MTQSRWRGLASVAAVVIVVGIVSLLLAHSFGGRGATVGAKATATTMTTKTPTPASNVGNTGNATYPVIAASDPQIVYDVQGNTIARSTDGGKTYTQVTAPPTTLKHMTFVVAVSPLDGNHLIATATGDRNTDLTCPLAPGQTPSADGRVRTRELADALSGYGACSQGFFSPDGGKTWNVLSLPYNDVIGSMANSRTIGSALFPPSATLFAQGNRLYAAIGQGSDYGVLEGGVGSHPVELVVSGDDGATWQVASNGLGANICDFAPAPTGQTVYAVVADQGCAAMIPTPLTLWRSNDAGASWAQVSKLPTNNELGMAVSPSGAIYINMPLGGPTADRGFTLNQGPQAVIVSTDGGATFTHAPTAGVSGFVSGDAFSGPVGALSDGSILMMASHSDGQTFQATFYAWQAGASAWRKVGAILPHSIVEVVVEPHGGGDVLYIVNDAGQISHVTA